MNGCFDLYKVLIWFSSWFTCWSFYGYALLIGNLTGTAVEVALPNIYVRDINDSLCKYTSVTSGMAGFGFCSA